MPADDEFFTWQHGVYAGDTNVRDVYLDECPEQDLPDWTPDPIDREWWEEELAHLESQRPDCLDCPLTLAVLDARIEEAREILSEQEARS
jgi:hypothetical protein